MRVPFIKVEGLANDFILVDARSGGPWVTGAVARRWCDRRRGIGADGVLTMLPSRTGAAFMHIYNSDGSEPEMCGNGLRCAVAFVTGALGPDGSASEARVSLETPAGLRDGVLSGPGLVRTQLGAARAEGRLDDLDLPEALEPGWRISMGNPHLVVWVEGDVDVAARDHGARLERHPAFPEGVNVGFARLEAPDRVRLVVHERGAGITQACGTGAAAAAAAARLSGRISGPMTVVLPGGACQVEVSPELAVTLEGPARASFWGEAEVSPAELRAPQRV